MCVVLQFFHKVIKTITDTIVNIACVLVIITGIILIVYKSKGNNIIDDKLSMEECVLTLVFGLGTLLVYNLICLVIKKVLKIEICKKKPKIIPKNNTKDYEDMELIENGKDVYC